jgi:hypothetical protein
MSDRSEVGLYFAPEGVPIQRRAPNEEPLREGMRLVGLYPFPGNSGAPVTLDAMLPDGTVRQLIDFTQRPGWDRRYVFDPPFDLPAGTRLRASDVGALVLNVVPSVP